MKLDKYLGQGGLLHSTAHLNPEEYVSLEDHFLKKYFSIILSPQECSNVR